MTFQAKVAGGCFERKLVEEIEVSYIMWGSIVMGVPNMDGFLWKIPSFEMDDDWGYPHGSGSLLWASSLAQSLLMKSSGIQERRLHGELG